MSTRSGQANVIASSDAASSVDRTARLKLEGEKYTLKLIATTGNERKVETWRIDSKEQEIHEGLAWLDRDGDQVNDGTCNVVTKGSSFSFRGERHPVEEDTPFKRKNGKKSFKRGENEAQTHSRRKEYSSCQPELTTLNIE